MSRFIKILRVKPSLILTLKNLKIKAVDTQRQHVNNFKNCFMHYFERNESLESLYLETIYDANLLNEEKFEKYEKNKKIIRD